MREAIQDLEKQKVTGFVLDLRLNPGGLLYSSTEIARMWMGEGTIVATVDREGGEDKLTSDKNTLTDKPLIILVDGGSASASEILAGAFARSPTRRFARHSDVWKRTGAICTAFRR